MNDRPLRVVHVFRAPVGGLFRHVLDLARGLGEQGDEIGIVCDSRTGGEEAERALGRVAQYCRLGVHRLPMPRFPGFGDFASARTIAKHCRGLEPRVLHGHGAKGGAYVRMIARELGAKAVYTPHGGSLHYDWWTPQGALFLGAERLLLPRTSGLLFVCDYERGAFAAKVGLGATQHAVVHNGLWPEEFEPVPPLPEASDCLFIGELRALKGVDVLIDALRRLSEGGHRFSAAIVGAGGERSAFESQVARLGLADRVRFFGPLPAREAFGLGRLLIVPSRAESFPYIVLEAAAAGLPIIASRVGGIGEILPVEQLVAPGDPVQLADAMLKARSAGEIDTTAAQRRMRSRFDARSMAEQICDFYSAVLDRPRRARASNRINPVSVA